MCVKNKADLVLTWQQETRQSQVHVTLPCLLLPRWYETNLGFDAFYFSLAPDSTLCLCPIPWPVAHESHLCLLACILPEAPVAGKVKGRHSRRIWRCPSTCRTTKCTTIVNTIGKLHSQERKSGTATKCDQRSPGRARLAPDAMVVAMLPCHMAHVTTAKP